MFINMPINIEPIIILLEMYVSIISDLCNICYTVEPPLTKSTIGSRQSATFPYHNITLTHLPAGLKIIL